MAMDVVHYSVLLNEILEYLVPSHAVPLFVDSTLGEGGHSEAFLKKYDDLQAACIDADQDIMSVARRRLEPFSGRTRFFNTWFNQFFKDYPLGGERPNLILFDLGISIYHYQKSNRGFSFQKEEPLDMRLSRGLETSAFDIVNSYPEEELANIIYQYGEDRLSRRIARVIVERRQKNPIETTSSLAEIVRGAYPSKSRYGRIHPATRTFQALRIAVNGELVRLEVVLENALRVLEPGGRMGVISFHSLEDRIVKWFFKGKTKVCTCPPDTPMCNCKGLEVVRILTKKPITPGEEEIAANPPSRSAKLRVIEKCADEKGF